MRSMVGGVEEGAGREDVTWATFLISGAQSSARFIEVYADLVNLKYDRPTSRYFPYTQPPLGASPPPVAQNHPPGEGAPTTRALRKAFVSAGTSKNS